jgi:hypothetical protein
MRVCTAVSTPRDKLFVGALPPDMPVTSRPRQAVQNLHNHGEDNRLQRTSCHCHQLSQPSSEEVTVLTLGRSLMRNVGFGLAAILVTFSLVGPADGMNFKCGTLLCGCTGTADCQDMRKSGMCSGTLDCHYSSAGVLVCDCTAARHGVGHQPPATSGTKPSQPQ